MNKIILSSNNEKSCLGHEIHITRIIIIDMLNQGFINENDLIVVKNNDKKFLYESLFKNVLNFNEYKNLCNNNYEIIDLTPYSISSSLVKITIPNFNYSQNLNNENFIKKILNFNFCDVNYKFINDYIVIHHRFNDNLDNLIKICRIICQKFSNLNVIIFNNNISSIKSILNDNEIKKINILFIDNLQLYASYLNNEKCKLLISEWSGGGQIAQYCTNNKIFYYCNFYNSLGYIGIEKQLIENAKNGSYFNNWDWKNPKNVDIKIFENLDELLNNISI